MIVAGPPNKKKEKADNTHNKPSTNGLSKDKPQLVKIQVLPTQTHNVTTNHKTTRKSSRQGNI